MTRTRFTWTRHALVLASAALFLLRPAHTQSEAKAIALAIYGDVSFIKDASQTRTALFQGGQVSPGQMIVTGHDGYGKFQVKDGSTFEVFPDSQVYFRNTTNFGDLLNVILGKVKVFIQHLPNIPNPNNVITPTALISVRGTEFSVTVLDLDGTTQVAVDEGVVTVKNWKMGGQVVTLNPGQATIVDPHVPLIGLGGTKQGILYRIYKSAEDLLYQGIPGTGPRSPGGGPTTVPSKQGDKGGKPTQTGTGTGSPTGSGSPTGTNAPAPPRPAGGGGD